MCFATAGAPRPEVSRAEGHRDGALMLCSMLYQGAPSVIFGAEDRPGEQVLSRLAGVVRRWAAGRDELRAEALLSYCNLSRDEPEKFLLAHPGMSGEVAHAMAWALAAKMGDDAELRSSIEYALCSA